MKELPLDRLLVRLQSLASDKPKERDLILAELAEVRDMVEEQDFMMKRLQKDKSIVINILKATITDLENSNLRLEEAHRELKEQNKALEKQKAIIEQNSAKLSDNLKEIEQSYHELEQFSYIASHDLQSPLRTISSFAQLLKKRHGKYLNEEALEFIDFIIAGGFRMHKVVRDLLQYSKVGKGNSGTETIHIAEVLELALLNLRKEIDENNAKICVDTLPVIKGIKTYLIQLFQNLIGNAIKFRSDESPKICIKSRQLQEQVWEFQVIDNGIGLPEVYHHKAFKPFQRLHNKNVSGTGIGLAICKKIVTIHKGNIHYQTNENGGANFIFTIDCNALVVDSG